MTLTNLQKKGNESQKQRDWAQKLGRRFQILNCVNARNKTLKNAPEKFYFHAAMSVKDVFDVQTKGM